MYLKKDVRHQFLIVNFIALFFLCCETNSYAQADFYVKEKPPCPTCDGLTWATAFDNLQSALDAASTNDEIWIAEGTYYPSKDATGNASPTDNRDKTFYIDIDLKIYGGFPNVGTPTMADRDWEAHPSILDGDLDMNDSNGLNGEDLFTHATRQNNAYTVLQTINLSNNSIFDGFVIQNGNASGSDPAFNSPKRSGGGMHNDNSSLTLQNGLFTKNSVDEWGGGIFTTNSNIKIKYIEFTNNWAGAGSGMFDEASDSHIENSVFSNNEADGAAAGYLNNGGNPILSKCIFTDNSSSNGGAMSIFGTESKIINCIFINNLGFAPQRKKFVIKE
ncbi:MAG: right-handed parallel beta-helix repeat-containing protein [Chitinophagales bacterium]